MTLKTTPFHGHRVALSGSKIAVAIAGCSRASRRGPAARPAAADDVVGAGT